MKKGSPRGHVAEERLMETSRHREGRQRPASASRTPRHGRLLPAAGDGDASSEAHQHWEKTRRSRGPAGFREATRGACTMRDPARGPSPARPYSRLWVRYGK